MDRSVRAELGITARGECQVELQIAVARIPGLEVTETLSVRHGSDELGVEEITSVHGGRIHLVTLPPGSSTVSYQARVRGAAEPAETLPTELSVYRRPSRYVASDLLAGFAASEFPGVHSTVHEPGLLAAVSSWVAGRLSYVPGSSRASDGATDTLLGGEGVCRDYAHVTIALLRALGVPARLAAVYAPGCDPMDFHAVAEAYVDGGWYVLDPTGLAPRSSLLRIATGRDAADTSFLSTVTGYIDLDSSQVIAVVDGELPGDDPEQLVVLG